MKITRSQILVATVIALALGGVAPATAEVDPFPGVAYQAEIAGTRITSAAGMTQSDWEASATYQSWRATHCAAGSGMGIGVDLNFTTDRSDDTWYAYCLKTWQPQPVVAPVIESSTVVVAPTSTVVESSTPVVTTVVESTTPVAAPVVAPVAATAPIPTTGLGGYAVVHPDGHVCGVIVATSTDPFGNGGTMPQEYMGCPAGARIVFQSAPSADGNVAGWHGPEVVLSGNTYSLPGGSTISGGVVTDPNGRTWNSGTGVTITPGVVDTRTVVSDTSTVVVDTSTVLIVDTTTAIVMPLGIVPLTTSAVDTATVVDDLDALPEIVAEEEPSTSIEARIVAGKTRIAVVSDFASTKMTVVASKKGSKKKYTYRISTNSNGELIFKSSVNLKGFTLVIYKDGEELDREVV